MGRLDRRRATATPGGDGTHSLSTTGLPLFAQNKHRICTIPQWTPGADDGHEPRHAHLSLRKRLSSISDPWDSNYRRFDFAGTWANGPAIRRARPSDPEGSRGGNRIRFSAAETDRLDKARSRVYRPRAGWGWPRPCGAPRFGPRNKSLPLGRPELPLLDVLQRRPASGRSASQPCRRAHDLPAERILNRGRSAWSQAPRSRAHGASLAEAQRRNASPSARSADRSGHPR